MKSLLALAFGALVCASACLPSVYMLNDDITGPHGEHLTKLACGYIEGCYRVAREQCGGDFDIAAQDVRPENTAQPNTLLYSCASHPASTGPASAPAPGS